MKALNVVAAFLGGLALGAAAGVLFAPEKGEDTRSKIAELLRKKGIRLNREEKVELVSGEGLRAYSVVCGSFGVKSNADGLKAQMDNEGYNAKVVYNAQNNMYRVIVESFDTRSEAARARDAFKAKYPNRKDFQGAWLLYRVN